MSQFVSSNDVPEDLAERVAVVAHIRGCISYDGRSISHVENYTDTHRDLHVVWAQINIADVCNALGLTPEVLIQISPTVTE